MRTSCTLTVCQRIVNIVGGFLKATSGEVTVEGQSVQHPDPRRIFVFQENGIFPWLNAHENVGFGLRQETYNEREQIIARYIEMVGLGGFECLSARTFRRDAPAGRNRARPRRQSRHHLHGRAVRGARFPHSAQNAQ